MVTLYGIASMRYKMIITGMQNISSLASRFYEHRQSTRLSAWVSEVYSEGNSRAGGMCNNNKVISGSVLYDSIVSQI